MNEIILTDRLADMWRSSRVESGKSQEYMAKALGVSKKTVQNWEAGLASPSLRTTILWFDALDIPMYPYLMKLLHDTSEEASVSNDQIKKELHTYIDEVSDNTARELLYLLFGSHGSSPKGVIEMITAYLHTPLSMRLNIASSILTNYEICQANGLIAEPEHIQPDFDVVARCYKAGKSAVLESKGSYLMVEGTE